MDDAILMAMALDELWALHQNVGSILMSRTESKKREVEDRLRQLSPDVASSPSAERRGSAEIS